MRFLGRYLVCFLLMSIPLHLLDRFGPQYLFASLVFPLAAQAVWWYGREIVWPDRNLPQVYGTKPELGFWF